MKRMIDEYIDEIYKLRYSLLTNNCFTKTRRIVRMARELGHVAHLVFCVSHRERSALFGWNLYMLHVYALVDGKKVDVSFDPETERLRMKNSDRKMTRGIKLPF